MSKRLIIASLATAAVVACGGLYLTVGAEEPKVADGRAPNVDGRGGTNFVSITDRGNTRTVFVSRELNQNNTADGFRLTAEAEVDATSITFAIMSTPNVPDDTAVNAYTTLGASTTYPANSYLKGTTTIIHNFNPPVRFRSGDYVGFIRRGGLLPAGARIVSEVAIYGFIPAANRTEGFQVQ